MYINSWSVATKNISLVPWGTYDWHFTNPRAGGELSIAEADGAVQERLEVADLGEGVLDPVDGGERGPSHGLKHRAEGESLPESVKI